MMIIIHHSEPVRARNPCQSMARRASVGQSREFK